MIILRTMLPLHTVNIRVIVYTHSGCVFSMILYWSESMRVRAYLCTSVRFDNLCTTEQLRENGQRGGIGRGGPDLSSHWLACALWGR